MKKFTGVGVGNKGEVLKIWVTNTKEKDPIKRSIEVRANLYGVLDFLYGKLKHLDWEEITKRKPKWYYPRIDREEIINILEDK